MGFLDIHPVVVKCPACQASTKVAPVPGRLAIRCPRCKASIPLTYAKKYTGEKAAVDSAVDEGVAESAIAALEPVPEPTRKPTPRSKKPAPDPAVFLYPDQSGGLIRKIFLIAGGLILAALLSVGYMIWRDANAHRHQEYLTHLREMVAVYRQAIDQCGKMDEPGIAGEVQKSIKDLLGRIDYLKNRLGHLSAPGEDGPQEIKDLQEEAKTLETQFAQANKKRQDRRPGTVSGTPTPVVSPSLGHSIVGNPPREAPSQAPIVPKVTETDTVMVIVPEATREQVDDDFLKRFAQFADDPVKGSATAVWSGDLLSVHVKPVVDPAQFATRINFGRLLYYSRADRSLTMQINFDRLRNTALTKNDPLNAIIADLKQREKKTKILPALNRLSEVRADRRQAEVAALLELIISQTDLDLKTREAAIKLIPLWAGRDSVPLLEKLLEDPSNVIRFTVVEVLVELKSIASAPAIAKLWLKIDAERISRAMVALGPEVEATVLPFLNNNNEVIIRTEACRVLREIGTTKSLKPLLDVINTQEQSPAVLTAAKDAMKNILERDSK